MKLPWWVWIAVGVPVLIVSSIMGFMLFVFIGVVFIIIGTAQLISLFVLSPRSKPNSAEPKKLYCPRCRVNVRPSDNFYRMCGQRLR